MGGRYKYILAVKKKHLTYPVLAVCLCMLCVINACQQDEEVLTENHQFVDDGAWLDITIPEDASQMSAEDLNILMQGFLRLDIQLNEDGLYEVTQQSGEEVNMSEELFEYLVQMVKGSNRWNPTSSIAKIKTRSESEDGQMTDCVAWAIAYATNEKYEDVNSWITEKYKGQGVPANEFYSVMRHFNSKGEIISPSEFKGLSIDAHNAKQYIIVLNNEHAVNLELKQTDSIIYWDAQNRTRSFCTMDDITHVYKLK